jgi:hypothetical protein
MFNRYADGVRAAGIFPPNRLCSEHRRARGPPEELPTGRSAVRPHVVGVADKRFSEKGLIFAGDAVAAFGRSQSGRGFQRSPASPFERRLEAAATKMREDYA